MQTLSSLQPAHGAVKRRRRVGRGNSSGRGTYSGRGIKGQRARSGGKKDVPLEGGRVPLVRHLPKLSGFTSPYPKAVPINIKDLERAFAPGASVDGRTLRKAGFLVQATIPYKILGNGKLTKPLTVYTQLISASARQAIVAAGGKVVGAKVIPPETKT